MNVQSRRIAYADCFSGVSGDMFLGALLDAGLKEEVLLEQLRRIDITGYALHVEDHRESGLKATRISVTADDDQPQRSWKAIRSLLEKSALQDAVKEKSLKIFRLLAEAEAEVHSCPVGDVHFHETGAIDALIDIVGAAVGMDALQIDHLVCSPLPMPSGWVSCKHGMLPLPAPAVCELTKGVPVYGVPQEQELVTPTGAAIIKALSRDFGQLPPMTVEQTGYGAGTHKLANGQPNLFRLIIGEASKVDEAQSVEVVETNLDDWSPETFPYLCEMLFKNGSLDVALVPMQMKKGRPGFLLQVITEKQALQRVMECILSETTAIGLRYHTEKRWTAPRETGYAETEFGRIEVKKIDKPTGTILTPEYESCRRVALERQVPVRIVYDAVCGCRLEDFKRSGR